MGLALFKDDVQTCLGMSRAGLLASAMLLISLALSLWSWQIIDKQRRREANTRFDLQRDRVVGAIENRMQAYRGTLEGAQGLFAASQTVERHEFRTYVEKLDIHDHHPGIQGIGYSEFIEPARLAAHVNRVRGEGFADYRVTPEGERVAYTAIVYLEPFDWRNRRAFGYDMFSEPVRRAAMERARDSGKHAVSGKVTLMQETDEDVQAGFLMYLPVYRNGAATATVGQRRRALKGYVYSPFRMQNLMRGVLGQDTPFLNLTLYSGGTVAADNLLYVSPTHNAPPGRSRRPGFERTTAINVGGHVWTLALTSTPAFEAGVHHQRSLAVLVVGGIFSMLLSGIVWVISSARDRAFALATRMTAELRAAKEDTDRVNARLLDTNRVLELEKKEREQAQAHLQKHARQLELKNRELQEFAHVASHDLQEPLHKIQAFGDLISSTEVEHLSESGCDYLRRMRQAAAGMRELIDDLLALSHITSQARPLVAVDLARIAHDVLSDLETRIERTGARVEIGALPTVDADPTQMRQLLQNLIGNALKFQRQGVAPHVKLFARRADEKDAATRWQIFIEDNGIGFDMKYLDRIFAPFQRLHSRDAYEGTGMGLTICQKIVARHGGEIAARSEAGNGSTFIITLPASQAADQRHPAVGDTTITAKRMTA